MFLVSTLSSFFVASLFRLLWSLPAGSISVMLVYEAIKFSALLLDVDVIGMV